MGKGKKKGDKDKKASKKDEGEEVATLEQLQTAFKKELKIANVSNNISKPINDVFDNFQNAEEDKGDFKQLCVTGLSDIDYSLMYSNNNGTGGGNNNNNINNIDGGSNDTADGNVLGCLSEAIFKSKYSKLSVLCFWRCKISDYGIESGIAPLIEKLGSLRKLELKDCEIGGILWKRANLTARSHNTQQMQQQTRSNISNMNDSNKQQLAKGIQSLSKAILVNNRTIKTLEIVRLDFNKHIGSYGLLLLSNGLQHNRCLKTLSLGFCNIVGNSDCINGLSNIFSHCYLLESLNLEGNSLGNKGIIGIIAGMNQIKSENFQTIDLNSNSIGENIDSSLIDEILGNNTQLQNIQNIKLEDNALHNDMTVTLDTEDFQNMSQTIDTTHTTANFTAAMNTNIPNMSSVTNNNENENKTNDFFPQTPHTPHTQRNLESSQSFMTSNGHNITKREISLNFKNEIEIIQALSNQFLMYDKLKTIYMHGNFFDENIAAIFLLMLVQARHISKFTVPHTLPLEMVDKFSQVTESHVEKPSKGGKKGGKKGKKSKKK